MKSGFGIAGYILTGKAKVNSLDKNKFATYEVSGALQGNQVELKGLKFTEKKGAWCLPTINLTFTHKKQTKRLDGKWKHNFVKDGCLLGLWGKVNVIKEEKVNVILTQTIADEDFEGIELAKALKNRKYYALIIAVEDYLDTEITDLDHPVTDAENLSKVLYKNYTFETENITLLKNPSRTEIIEAFDLLSETVDNTDNLVIFYAGHGIWDEQLEQGYWLPNDAAKNSKAQWISNGTIRDYIRAIKSKHTLIISDACFSGGILKERSAFTESKAMLELYKLPSRKAMTSGALKTVPDKSVFIEYLLKNLERNELPLISAEQLYHNFKLSVINNSASRQVPQYGVIQQSDDEGGDFIFLMREN